MPTNKQQWEEATAKITPPEQGPLDEGGVAQPKHTEADPLQPIKPE